MHHFLHEIRSQKPAVRFTLFVVSSVVAVSFIGYYWFTDFERTAYLALHSDPAQQEAFLAQQESRSPQVMARLSRSVGSLTAAIGNLLGFDRSDGFDTTPKEGDTPEPVYTLPLAR